MSVNKFDLMKKTYDMIVKQDQLMRMNIQFYQEGKFMYPFFLRKNGKAQTMVFKFDAEVVSVNPDVSVVVRTGDCKCLNEWLRFNGCVEINPNHFVVSIKKINEPNTEGLVGRGVLHAKFAMILCEEKLKPESEDMEYDVDDDDAAGDNRYFIEKKPLFWLSKFVKRGVLDP